MTEGPDFVVLTGFLGSGKTTLLRDYLRGPAAADTAVIVNEAGEIGLDGVILRESGGDVPMTTLSNGCICCQLGSSLAVTIEALLAAERPDCAGPLRRIVLETSGLAKPGPVLRQLAALADHRMRVCVLATYDALHGTRTEVFEEAAAQWAAAHRIVLTKTDVVSPARLAEARGEIAGLNPLAQVIVAAERGEAVAAAFAPLTTAAPLREGSAATNRSAHPRVAVRLARPTGVLAYDDLAAWLDNLAGALGERLLRLKGLVTVAGSEHPVLVESVGTLFSPPRLVRPSGEPPSPFLVVILRDARTGELERVTPIDLFRFTDWSEPTAFSRPGAGHRMRAEAV